MSSLSLISYGPGSGHCSGGGEEGRVEGRGKSSDNNKPSPPTHTHSLTRSLTHTLTHTHTHTHNTGKNHLLTAAPINGGTHARSAPCHVTGLVSLGPPRLVVLVLLAGGTASARKTTNPVRNCM